MKFVEAAIEKARILALKTRPKNRIGRIEGVREDSYFPNSFILTVFREALSDPDGRLPQEVELIVSAGDLDRGGISKTETGQTIAWSILGIPQVLSQA